MDNTDQPNITKSLEGKETNRREINNIGNDFHIITLWIITTLQTKRKIKTVKNEVCKTLRREFTDIQLLIRTKLLQELRNWD